MPQKRQPQHDDRFLRVITRVAIIVLILMVVILPLSEVFDLPFVRADFRVDPAVFGLIIAALLTLLGAVTLRRFPGFTFGEPEEDEDDADHRAG